MTNFTRRSLIGAASAVSLGGARAFAEVAKPPRPLTLNIVDAAGNLALTRPALENYRRLHPDLVAGFTVTSAPSPEIAPKLQAQRNAGKVDIDIVIIGPDNVSPGIEQGLLSPLLPNYADALPNLQEILLAPAWKLQELAKGYAVLINYYPSGPLIEYMPEQVPAPPRTAADLLAWAKQHPNRFTYARPTNSGPARTLLMGLPYILGDRDPKDPKDGWERTWAYLKELGQTIDYYPSGTAATMKELGEGTRDMIASTTGWDINPRALGIVPKSAKIGTLEGFHWMTDGHYFAVPNGADPARIPVIVDLIGFLLSKPSQAYAYDKGYLYPGPAVKDVPLSAAPAESQQVIEEFGRPEYARLIAEVPSETPLGSAELVYAFRRWDTEIGAK